MLPLLYLLLACAGSAPTPSTPKPAAAPSLSLVVEYGSEKKSWMEEMVRRFEAGKPTLSSGEVVDVQTVAAGSGEAVLDILSGAQKPHVFSPASGAYIGLLNEQWQQQPGHTAPLCPPGEALVLSPVVIAMWKPMAEALGWPGKPIGWADLLKISASPEGWAGLGHPEWGRMKLGHTHPRLSNSGLLGVVAEVYAGAGKTRDLQAADLSDPKVEAFVAGVEGSLVHYGKSTSFFADKMQSRGPGYISAAVLYENVVIESYNKPPGQFPLVSVYPVEGTFWSDHPYAVLDAPQVGPKEKEAAQLFLNFLKSKPAQEAALTFGFRPGDPAVAIGAPIDAAHGADPAQPQTLLDLPSPAVLNGVLDLWDRTKKTSDVVLVFDKSGSMNGEPLRQAQGGAAAFLDALGDRDSVSVQFFDNTVLPASPPTLLGGGGRDRLKSMVAGSIASGGTALYDAVQAAYASASQRAAQEPGRIHAVVVMTDGKDEDSKLALATLQEGFRGGDEAAVRVFTIAYGQGADPTVLTGIAEAGGGATAAGDTSNIDALFRDMAAFF